MSTTEAQDVLAGRARWAVVCSDALDALKQLPDGCCDAVVTDPPYALTDRRGGAKGFMSAAWDNGRVAHDPAFWAEVRRVAKPGAHLVAFGGTRTAHRLACAIEDAGWAIRDSLYWLHGQGFPKSADISKAIDKMVGAEREVVGTWKPTGTARIKGNGNSGHGYDHGEVRTELPLTAPATDAAKQWAGFGTALKPSAEPIVLARKPLAAPTVAANVLAHGTGALHIDACRVPTAQRGEDPRGQGRPKGRDRCFPFSDDAWGNGHLARTEGHAGGRWPSNLVLSHVPPAPDGSGGCQPAGVRRVRGAGWRDTDVGTGNAAGIYGGGPLKGHGGTHHTDAEGYEQVQAYACVPQCPIRLLDEQAGPRTSGGSMHERSHAHNGIYGAPGGQRQTRRGPDEGNCSRFFPTFAGPDAEDAVPFRYCSKASRRDREGGLDGLPRRRGAAEQYDPRWKDGIGEQRRPVVRNTHPCVKPTSLARWLARLICAPSGVVLDPFCGSGSLGVGAVLEGFRYIGIEMAEEYCDIARARIAHAEQQVSGPLFAGVVPSPSPDAAR